MDNKVVNWVIGLILLFIAFYVISKAWSAGQK